LKLANEDYALLVEAVWTRALAIIELTPQLAPPERRALVDLLSGALLAVAQLPAGDRVAGQAAFAELRRIAD
jgi:hypothetical protein